MYFKKLFSYLMIFTICFSAVLSLPATAQSEDIPLVVIRYNQPRVYYDRQLYNAASKAVKIKPNVMFSVVSFVPQNGSDRRQETLKEQSERQIAQLVKDLRKIGVPKKQINVSTEYTSEGRFHEAYIYID